MYRFDNYFIFEDFDYLENDNVMNFAKHVICKSKKKKKIPLVIKTHMY